MLDDRGRLKGMRPLGGAVEFGETWQQALLREFREELNLSVQICGAPIVLENIFRHEGVTGHEVVFVAPVQFPEGALANKTEFKFSEYNGTICTARWFNLQKLMHRNLALFPEGLKTPLDQT